MFLQKRMLALLGLLFLAHVQAKNHNIFWKSDENGVYVIDGVFNKATKALRNVVSTFKDTNWRFTVDETIGHKENQSLKMGFATKSSEIIQNLSANKVMGKLVSEIYGLSKVALTETQGRMVERGDFNPVINHCFQDSSQFLALLTLSKKWKKNDYGEITVYDKDGEVLKSIFPRFGRVILIPCGIQFKISPPCLNAEIRHYFLLSEFGENLSKSVLESEDPILSDNSLTRFFADNYEKDKIQYQDFEPEKCVTKKFYTNDGKKIFVYDDVFPAKAIDVLHQYIVNIAEYYESPVVEKDSADNVKWIISLDDPDFEDGPIWNLSRKLLAHIAGKEFFPYDLACNHVRRTDNTLSHKDNYEDADEYTVLIYLNKDWTENDYGETTFLQDNEIVAALRPRYGRVVIFHGTIDHSAHPSSPEHQGARYTFAIKTAATREHALNRILESEAGLSFSGAIGKLKSLETKGTSAQKKFAKIAIDTLKNGRIPSSEFLAKLQEAIKL